MSPPLDHTQEQRRIEQLRRGVASLDGARDEMTRRVADLTDQVALAKGRIALKDKVEAFLQDLQTAAHRRNVAAFERMLSLLVGEVLPGSPPIDLELSTERGLPSLDINTVLPDGTQEDVYKDHGGAMTNVVSSGLRIIAAVKSRGRRFLVLDEPDCWIAPDRVSDFFRVFREAADKIGVQCLVISHHPQAYFGGGVAIAHLETRSDGTASIASPDVDGLWTPDAEGIRSIRLIDFQAHPDSTLRLAPGVTALAGPNDKGKSCIVRAFAAACHGDTRDGLIRHGEKQCAVEIDLGPEGRLRFSRARRRNPTDLWLLEKDGQVVERDGVRYETGGRTLPDWIPEITGIATIDDLRINISNQKEPVFLLADSPSRRASVLSVGQESSHLRTMIGLQRERTVRDQGTIRDGEREIGSLKTRIERLEGTAAIGEAVSVAESHLARSRSLQAEQDALAAALARHDQHLAALAQARNRAAALASVPREDERDALVAQARRTDDEDRALTKLEDATARLARARATLAALARLPEESPKLAEADAMSRLIERIERDRRALASASARAAALAELPDAPPALTSSQDMISAGTRIAAAQRAIAPETARLAEINAAITDTESELADILREMGNLCPTCGQPVTSAAFLEGGHADGAHAP